ncbi:MAG: hypothetical protein QW764_02510 [Desulfurococcaceae archaeon]
MLLELFISELVLLSAYAMPAPLIPIAQIAHIEAHSEVDFTGQGRCRVENTSMEKGWVYFGTTQKGYHFRGLTDSMEVVENTCKWDCGFKEVLRVYRVEKDKVYLVYPEERELKCKDYVEEDIGEVNDTYLACFRKELYSDGVR